MDDMAAETALRGLIASLEALICVLRHDPDCQWTEHFVASLDRAESLLTMGALTETIERLAAAITSVYAGVGSFGDYVPIRIYQEDGRLLWSTIEGMERLDEVAREVYRRAYNLRALC